MVNTSFVLASDFSLGAGLCKLFSCSCWPEGYILDISCAKQNFKNDSHITVLSCFASEHADPKRGASEA